jgi:hypothetical protein
MQKQTIGTAIRVTIHQLASSSAARNAPTNTRWPDPGATTTQNLASYMPFG